VTTFNLESFAKSISIHASFDKQPIGTCLSGPFPLHGFEDLVLAVGCEVLSASFHFIICFCLKCRFIPHCHCLDLHLGFN
jgi:hypothetical protein